MKVIPSTIFIDQGGSRRRINSGERKVFDELQEINFGNLNDVALHSFNITDAIYQRWCETDFVLISKFGLLLIEVKSGPISCKGGIWKYSNKKTRNSPATQAKNAFFFLEENYLKKDVIIENALEDIPTGFCCVFTDVSRLVGEEDSQLPEQGDEITCYMDEFRSENGLKNFILRVSEHYKSTLIEQGRNPREMTKDHIETVKKRLRPEFDQGVSLEVSLNDNEQIMQSLTEEQYEKIDFIEDAPRVMIHGGAGTGKTTLALYSCRQEAAKKRKTLFLSSSPTFIGFIKNNTKNDDFDVHSIDELVKLNQKHIKYDSLIMDEGQDLCRMNDLDLMDQILSGGLESGRWRWFGDPNNQISHAVEFDDDAYNFLASQSHKSALKYNVRNTPPIIDWIELYTKADMGSSEKYQGSGLPHPQIGSSPSIDDTYKDAKKALLTWIEAGAGLDDIAILVPHESFIASAKSICLDLGMRHKSLDLNSYKLSQSGFLIVSTFENFKGLERQCVCILGLDEYLKQKEKDKDEFRRQIYLSASRANYQIYIAASKDLLVYLTEINKYAES